MIVKTVYVPNIRKPDRIKAVCGEERLYVSPTNSKMIGAWAKEIWSKQMFAEPVYIYYDIDWDNDNVLYCKYEMV